MAVQSIKFVAPIIRAALASLEAGWAAQIAAFNAEPANLVDLEAPPASLPGFAAGGGYVFGADPVPIAFPYVEASIMRGTMGPFSVGTAGVGDADSTPTLQVIVWLEGLTGEIPPLYEAGIGYARIVIELLTVDGAIGEIAEVSGTREDAITYSIEGPLPVNPEEENREFRKWRIPVVVSFAVEAVDSWS